MWILNMPVLSTGHLPSETAVAEADLYAAPYNHGWFVHVDAELESTSPEWYAALARWAAEQGFEWVRFDSDGDIVDELQTWVW